MCAVFIAVVEMVDSGTGPNEVPRDLCLSPNVVTGCRWALGPDQPATWRSSSGYRAASA